jgi:hypothetical protein
VTPGPQLHTRTARLRTQQRRCNATGLEASLVFLIGMEGQRACGVSSQRVPVETRGYPEALAQCAMSKKPPIT